MQLAHTLDGEFKRVAKAEEIAMDQLVDEVARLAGCKPRMVYNYRSGKWPIPHTFFAAACKRFRSTTLIDVLRDDCHGTPVEVPEAFELSRLISQTVRDDLRHYEKFLDAFESNGVDSNELADLVHSGSRVIQNVHQFLQIARSDYEQRHQRQHAAAN